MPRRRNLTLTVPRTGRTWIFLASSFTAVAFSAGWLFIDFPAVMRPGLVLLAALLLVLIAWALLPSGTVVFDVGSGIVFKDGWRIARFADVDCVLITEPGLDKEEPYFVELRLQSGREILLGYTKEQVDASSLAARVAGAIDRPVKVAGYAE